MSPLAPPQEFRKTAGIHRTGLASEKPAATDVLIGTLFFATDALTLERSNGSTWVAYANNSGGGGGGAHHTTHEPGGSDEILNINASHITSGTLIDDRLSGNVALRDAFNTYTQNAEYQSVSPRLHFRATAETLNNKLWRLHVANGGQFLIDSMLDDGTAFISRFTFMRNGGLRIVGALTVDGSATWGGGITIPSSSDLVLTTDPRLTDARTPTNHATRHSLGGVDPVTVTNLAGYPGGTTNFLRADGTFAAPSAVAAAHHTTHEPGGTDALVNAAWTNVANIFTQDQQITKTNAELSFLHSGTAKGRIFAFLENDIGLARNIKSTDGSVTWNLDNTAVHGAVFRLGAGGNLVYYTFTAGANPRTPFLAFIIDPSGNTTIGGNLTVTGSGGNVACKDQANAFTATQTIANIAPALTFNETDAGVDQKAWQLYAEANYLRLAILNDAGAGIGQPLYIDRAGNMGISGQAVSASINTGGLVCTAFTLNGGTLTINPGGTNGAYIDFLSTGGHNFFASDNSVGSIFASAGYAAVLYGGTTGGVSITAAAASGTIRFSAGGITEYMRLSGAGELFIGTTAALAQPGKVCIVFNSSVKNLLVLQDTNASLGGGYQVFLNSAGGVAGSINHSGTTAVVYNTTSDKRLKTDLGIATDVSALKSVVVHDFYWTADEKVDRGIFAQDTYPVFPRAVTPGNDVKNRPWMTDYSRFVPDLLVGWQQHEERLAKVEELLCRLQPQN